MRPAVGGRRAVASGGAPVLSLFGRAWGVLDLRWVDTGALDAG